MSNFESRPALRTIEKDILDDIRELAAAGKIGLPAAAGAEGARFESFLEPRRGSGTFDSLDSPRRAEAPTEATANYEAIVLSIARPSLLVKSGSYVMPDNESEKVLEIIRGFKREGIDKVIARTGRVEFANVPGVPYVGTGWIVDKPSERSAVIVTNRHVASEFAAADGRGGYRFNTLPNFRDYEVKIDFLAEHENSASREADAIRVAFIAGDSDADIALLVIEGDAVKSLSPVELATAKLTLDTPLGVVGYPAYDSRSDEDDVRKYFGIIFDVKRFAFGNVTKIMDYPEFTHDATTLGGNSGSCVFDRDSGKAVGLHFAGDYKVANYAVPVSEVAASLKGLKTQSVVPSIAATEAAGDGRSAVASFRGRDGYAPKFLDGGAPVLPPKPGAWKGDLCEATDADTGKKTRELKYRHFSVWMSRSRKLPLLTAVNIDGDKAKNIGRTTDKWFIDERLGADFQIDNAAYRKNALDRGHMVRRQDPVWGTRKEAAQANLDTFHYTNSAPQHEELNQRDWVSLEDYILGNARTHNLKVSVFTGPILAEKDPLYRNLVRLPRAFWKIAAVINSETRKLSVTGYVLCQGNLIKDLTSEFVYGAFRTYQVPLPLIAEQTRLDLGHLVRHDPLEKRRKREGIEATTKSLFIAVSGPSDLVL